MNPIRLALRTAAAADAPRVAALLIATRRAFMPYAPPVHTDRAVRRWVAEVLVPHGGVTVAEAAGTVVATMATTVLGGVAWIEHMAVDPACVGQGIGTTLLGHATRTLPRPIRLFTFQQNTGARRFYARHGFSVVCLSDGGDNEERCPDVLLELGSADGR